MTNPHTIEVTERDFPLRCPPAGVAACGQHPLVFLNVQQSGKVICPYCRTHYVLKGQAVKGH